MGQDNNALLRMAGTGTAVADGGSTMKRILLPFLAVILAGAAFVRGAGLPMAADGTNRWAWSEGAGWVNARPTHTNLQVFYDGPNGYLSGYAWSENVGWLKFGSGTGPYANSSSNNWGVNMNAQWQLSGYAWSENAGWINFAPTHNQVTVEPYSGGLSGYAWAENLGWVSFTNASPAYFVRVQVGYATNDVPYWWMWDYGFTSNFDLVATNDADKDGALTWQEYVAGTDPTNDASVLSLDVPGPDSQPPAGVLLEWLSRTDRIYTLTRSTNLLDSPPFVQIYTDLPGSNGVYRFTDTNAVIKQWYWYRLKVRRQ